MDNQQGKINDIRVGWIAGLIDGEGCIDLQQSKANYYKKKDRQGLDIYYYPRVRITMTHPQTLVELVKELTVLNMTGHISWRQPSNKKWKKSWTLQISGLKRVKRFLTFITPHLVTKQNEAEKMLDFIDSRLSHEQHDGYSNKEESIIKELRNR